MWRNKSNSPLTDGKSDGHAVNFLPNTLIKITTFRLHQIKDNLLTNIFKTHY
jgi:hypothetical protein